MASARTKIAPAHFKTMIQADVPQGRNGKHKEIVSIILDDLSQLKEGAAIKVPLLRFRILTARGLRNHARARAAIST